MHLNFLNKSYTFKLFTQIFIFFIVFAHAKSTGESSGVSFDAYTPRYEKRAWYVIELGNIPIGTAIVSKAKDKKNTQSDYALQIVSRVGNSPITSEIFVHIQNNMEVEQKFLTKTQNGVLSENAATFFTQKKNFFIDNKNSSFEEVLSPFPKDLFKLDDKFEAHYSKDKFLQTATLNIRGSIQLKFKRINEIKYQEDIQKIFSQKIDLGHLNTLGEDADEIENLIKNLSDCQSEMQNLNKSILKQMPHESYLMYRRIINLNQFCSKLETILTDNESASSEKKSYIIAESVKKLLNEDKHELPHAITQFSERALYYNHSFSFLWARITKILIRNAVKEMSNLYRLDLNRKSLLGIHLKISSMQPRAVVRADITQIDSPLHFSVQTDEATQMKASSLTQTSENGKINDSYYLNGMSFANQINFDLNAICQNNTGNIGIDLGDIPQGIVILEGVRGVWDVPTKLATARLFAIQATSEKTCSHIFFRTDSDFAKFLTAELDTLKNESLSLENSMLVSNYGQKKLWVMPGKYRITISSIINEKVISLQEFMVGDNTQTNVIANVH